MKSRPASFSVEATELETKIFSIYWHSESHYYIAISMKMLLTTTFFFKELRHIQKKIKNPRDESDFFFLIEG